MTKRQARASISGRPKIEESHAMYYVL